MTITEIKRQVRRGLAEDITTASEEKLAAIGTLTEIGYSVGTYGVNAALFISADGKLYAITSRSTNLFRLM